MLRRLHNLTAWMLLGLVLVLLTNLEVTAGAKGKKRIPNATIDPQQLIDFEVQPKKVQQLIQLLLDLTAQNLTYRYGSADPGDGGMDCSGTMNYVLRKCGFSDVPRMAHQQYQWAWEEGRFHAVVGRDPESFQWAHLRPGDMLFWSGTYEVERQPPVTHAMIFLGWLKSDGRPVMAGASNGRSFAGKPRHGVSVFDFRLPRPQSKARFLGYARLPGIHHKKNTPPSQLHRSPVSSNS